MLKYLSSASVACGDTTKTLIETLVVPAKAKRIVGAWAYAIGGPGLTTLENNSGLLELESPDVAIVPCQLPLNPVAVLTNGVAAPELKVYQLDTPVSGGERISGYVTQDMALTVANKARFGIVVEV